MADADLEEIRKARLAQLQGSSSAGGNSTNPDPDTQADQQRQRESDARASLVAQIVTPEAADRLNRIKLVKATRAEDVENRLIMLARGGQLRGRVTEDQLKQILAAMAEQEEALRGGAAAAGIQVVRRGGDDDDELDELMRGLEG